MQAGDQKLRDRIAVLESELARCCAERDAARQAEEQFHLFSDSVREYALIMLDPEGRIVAWNRGAESIFGYSEAEIVGQPASRFLTSEDIGRGEPDWDLSQAGEKGRSEADRWMVRRDGSRFWARCVTTRMRDEHGNLRGFARVLRDETERKHTEDEALDRSKEELRALAGSLITVQEEERRRIARELHDDLNQQLAVLGLGLARLGSEAAEPEKFRQELSRLEILAASLSEDLRRLSHQLHPSMIYHLGLPAALRNLVEEFQRGHPQPVHFEGDLGTGDVSPDIAAAIYRITQEALRNIAKHAPSAPVNVIVAPEPDGLHLTIEDKGPGFDPEAVRGKGGLGIISMQERTQIVGGSFTMHSEPSLGTRIDVRVPLTRQPA